MDHIRDKIISDSINFLIIPHKIDMTNKEI